VKSAIVEALCTSQAGGLWLLELHDKQELPENLQADVARLLRNSPFKIVQNKAMLVFPPPGRIDPKKLPTIPALVARKGNADHGRQLMLASMKNDLQCMKCHTIRGQGGHVGPELSVIGKKAGRDNLFESILYPSKAIADQYLTWIISTTKGVDYSGLIVEETTDHVTVRDANGADHEIAKKDIENRDKSKVSLMPDNLLVYMTEDDLVDIVEYISNLKTPVLSAEYWHIAGPFDNGVNDAGLDKAYPPEKEIDLKGSYDGKPGKVSWRTVKSNKEGYFDLQAFLGKDSDNSVSYLYRQIESPADQDAEVLLGTDDGCKLWVNDQLLHTSRTHRAAIPEQDHVKIKLKKGINNVLLKINNGDGPHGFYFTMVAEQEVKFTK
jgi:putative heme-binding domain-containing protein